MKKLYKAVLEETKRAVKRDTEEKNSAGLTEETHRMIDESIRLYNCLRTGVVTGSELFSPDDKETGR